MISDSNHILYACISKGTTVLADLNSGDHDLEALASQCLEKTPDFHGFYSHTLRKRMYCFLIDNPLIYFAVVDEDLGKPQVLDFLHHLKDAFATMKKKKRIKNLDRLTHRCFQEEFDPVFSHLTHRENSVTASEASSVGKSTVSTEAPLLANQEWYDEDAMVDVALDANEGHELSREITREISRQMSQKIGRQISHKTSHKTSRQISQKPSQKMSRQMTHELIREEIPMSVSTRKGIPCMGNESLRQSAWRSWKRQVCIALVVDLVLCCILLGIWLAVCNGFQCTKN